METTVTLMTDKLAGCNLSLDLGNCSPAHNMTMLHSRTPEAIIVPCVFAVILIVGLVGNFFLILSFAQHKTMTTTHNVLVVNLALGDFIFLVVSLPFNSVWYTLPYWPFGPVICKLSYFAEGLATSVVITTLSALSIERCMIVTGRKLWRQQSRREPIYLTVSIWVMAVVVSVPTLLSTNLNEALSLCDIYDVKWGPLYPKIHVIMRFILLFCLPLLVIATAYTIIAIHLLLKAFPLSDRRRTEEKLKNQRSPQSLKGSKPGNHDTEVSANNRNPSNSKLLLSVSVGRGDNTDDARSKECLLQPNTPEPRGSLTVEDGPEITNTTADASTTPVYPKSFVYTGPAPIIDLPYHRKPGGCSAETQEAVLSKSQEREDEKTAPKSLKETTPLKTEVRLDGTKLSQKPARPKSMLTKRRRLAMTVLMLILAFAICWTPRHIYFIWFYLHPGGDFNLFWHVFKLTGFCLSFSNSAINPVVFYVLDNKYRTYVHSVLCALCWKCCKRPPLGTETVITLGERDYNATVAPTASNENVTQL